MSDTPLDTIDTLNLGSLDEKGKPVETRLKDVKSALGIYTTLRTAAEKSAPAKPMLVGKGGIGVCRGTPRHSSELVDELDKKLSRNDLSKAAAEHLGGVRLMLAGSCWERDCERHEPKSVSRPADGLASRRRRT